MDREGKINQSGAILERVPIGVTSRPQTECEDSEVKCNEVRWNEMS